MRRYCALLVAAPLAAFAATPALGQLVCEVNYIGPTNGKWSDPANWDNLAGTSSTTVACIPAGSAVKVDDVDAYAEAIWVKRSGSSVGTVEVSAPGFGVILHLYGHSVIDGVLEIGKDGALQAETDALTISGTGGEIIGTHALAFIDGRFGGPAGGTRLTFAPGGGGGSRDASLVVHGQLRIRTPIVNDKAYVVADWGTLEVYYAETELRSSSATKGAYWVAERHPVKGTIGTLVIRRTVGGVGRWELVSDPNASIRIEANCARNTGPVNITNGKFIVGSTTVEGADFRTTGRITLQSVDGSTPSVYVHEGNQGKFDN